MFAVGDPDQAIFRFRGASSAAFQEFQRRFPGSEVGGARGKPALDLATFSLAPFPSSTTTRGELPVAGRLRVPAARTAIRARTARGSRGQADHARRRSRSFCMAGKRRRPPTSPPRSERLRAARRRRQHCDPLPHALPWRGDGEDAGGTRDTVCRERSRRVRDRGDSRSARMPGRDGVAVEFGSALPRRRPAHVRRGGRCHAVRRSPPRRGKPRSPRCCRRFPAGGA